LWVRAEEGTHDGVDGTVQRACEDFAHATIVLLAAKETVCEDDRIAERARLARPGGRFPQVVSQADIFPCWSGDCEGANSSRGCIAAACRTRRPHKAFAHTVHGIHAWRRPYDHADE